MSSETPYPHDPHAQYAPPPPAGGPPTGDLPQYQQQPYQQPRQQYPQQPVAVHSAVEYSTAQLVAFQFMADQGLLPQGIAPGYPASSGTATPTGTHVSTTPGYPPPGQQSHIPAPQGAPAQPAPQALPHQPDPQYPQQQQASSQQPHAAPQAPQPATQPPQQYATPSQYAPQQQPAYPQMPAPGGPPAYPQTHRPPHPMPPASPPPPAPANPTSPHQRTTGESPQPPPSPASSPVAQPDSDSSRSREGESPADRSPRPSPSPAAHGREEQPDSSTASTSPVESAPETTSDDVSDPRWRPVSRGVAMFLGAFSLLNLAAQLRYPGFDANIWWIDLRALPAPAARGLLSLVAVLLICFAIRPHAGRFRWWPTFASLLTLLGISLTNTARYYELLRGGQILGGTLLPYSLHIAACLSVVLAGVLCGPSAGGQHRSSRGSTLRLMALTVFLCMVAFPLAQMMCFGPTDYRRPADAAVVFGCKVDGNGRASDALTDRVHTACDLYDAGLVKTLIFSGGPGEGSTTEPDAMKQLALQRGVPNDAIILDPAGLSTEATVTQSAQMFSTHNVATALAVSHDYHLPRIKLCYRRAGIDVLTVPARETVRLKNRPWFLLREIAALWACYLRPLT